MTQDNELAIRLHRELRRRTSPGLHKFKFSTAHEYYDILPAMLRFRARHFKDYDVSFHEGLEFDQFDTPYADYLVSRDARGQVQSCARLIRCDRPYMLEVLWKKPFRLELPCDVQACEVSRFALESRAALPDMIRGLVEYAYDNQLTEYLFLSHKRMIQRILGPHALVEAISGQWDSGESACRVVLTAEVLDKTLAYHKVTL